MPKLLPVLAVIVLLLLVPTSTAQVAATNSAQAVGGTGSGSGSGSGGMVGGIGGFIGSSMVDTRNHPFSADTIDETDQLLADGNHIHHELHGKFFRDSEGRTRTETEFILSGRDPMVHVIIFDPTEKLFISLDPQHKRATVSHFGSIAPSNAGKIIQNQSPKSETAGTNARLQLSFKSQSEDLGTKEIDGFTVTGKRFTRTTPSGADGNDKPLVSTNEIWISSDLKAEIMTRIESPQSGQHVHRLVNIQQGDPDPLLFQVPADYTVKEQSPK